jgi:hypothetical protein
MNWAASNIRNGTIVSVTNAHRCRISCFHQATRHHPFRLATLFIIAVLPRWLARLMAAKLTQFYHASLFVGLYYTTPSEPVFGN